MKVEYEKPWFVKPKLGEDQKNIIMNSSYTISLSFSIGQNYKRDDKIGFFGVPGKNFGISYDYLKKLFVFEFWTKDLNGDPIFNCYTYESITDKMYDKKTNITLTYNGSEYKVFFDFKLLDLIESNSVLIDDYINEPIYIGCHNIDSINQSHRNLTEMDVFHFSIFKTSLPINEVKMFVKKTNRNLDKFSDNLLCVFDFESQNGDEFIILDEYKDKYFLKKKNKNSSIGFEIAKKKLDDVGCGFCLAKWTQVTMHLHNGTTHSCHHPEPHKVSLEELSRNPTALHNSKVKKMARKEMLENKRPSECSYCWNVEDNSNSFSDRVFKSSEPWSEPFFDEISKSDWRDNYNPKYVEVSFSNTCNFKCAYCGPEYSSKWMEEINDHGPYQLSFEYNGTRRMEERNTKPYKHSDDNPYVNSFWEWFPDLYNSMDTFRITGGEPLLSKDTWKVLDFILETNEPNRNLKLSINSNLGVPDYLIDRLIEKLDDIIRNNLVKEIIIFTSCDGYGIQSEYTRYGMNFEKLFNNIDKVLTSLPKITVVVMSTFNIFSVFSYEDLIRKIHELKIKHFNPHRYWSSAIILDTSYLRQPSFMSFRLLKGYIEEDFFDRWIKYMKFNSTYRSLNFLQMQNVGDVGFSTQEIEKISRLKDIFISDKNLDDSTLLQHKIDLNTFVKQYESRRGLKVLEIYPELESFFEKIDNENTI
jgi:MoaA/NifB/PqqE/SkfB family radical SAM enzyme